MLSFKTQTQTTERNIQNWLFYAASLIYLAIFSLLLSASTNANEGKKALPIEELKVFTEAFSIIRENYVEDIQDPELFESAIRGMLRSLDNHSDFLNTDQLQNLVIDTSGKFYGIGIEVEKKNDLLTITHVFNNSPAQRAGLYANDIILQINQFATSNLSITQATQLIKSSNGASVDLNILPYQKKTPRKIKLRPEEIVLENVTHKLLDNQYAYIRIASFQSTTTNKVKAALQAYKEKFIKGIIIDVRDNPGGFLQAAVDTTDLFLDNGLIVFTQGKTPQSRQEFYAGIQNPSQGIPTAILINEKSASAAEILAAALQDHRRAVIIGTKSFGKGSIQTVIPISNNRAIKLTTGLYYTPTGRAIQANGVEPDIEIISHERFTIGSSNDQQLNTALAALKNIVLDQQKENAKFLEYVE